MHQVQRPLRFRVILIIFSCQLFTTAPRLENSTRYNAFSTTIVRSCASDTAGVFAAAADAVVVVGSAALAGPPLPGVVVLGVVVLPGVPAVAGPLTAGVFGCGRTGAFGAKNFAHSRITPMESNEATRMRSSGVNLSFGPSGGN